MVMPPKCIIEGKNATSKSNRFLRERETTKKAPKMRYSTAATVNIPKNFPRTTSRLLTGFANSVKIVPLSLSFDIAFTAEMETKTRQHTVIVEIPISFTSRSSSPKANKVKKRDKNVKN